MYILKKCGLYVSLVMVGAIYGMTLFSYTTAKNNDWLKKTYYQSHNPGQGSSEPYAFDLEAEDLFDTKIDLGRTIGDNLDGDESNNGIKTSDSVFVRAARFMMRVAVVFAIPMLIYAAIRIMLALGDKSKMQDALKQVGMVVLGVIVALMSVMIIYLVTSLTRSSLGGAI